MIVVPPFACSTGVEKRKCRGSTIECGIVQQIQLLPRMICSTLETTTKPKE